jgi:hypothetical protein
MASDWKPETWVAGYAAVVATSAFLLNLKTWFESGVRLRLSVIAEGVVVGGGPEFDEKDLIILNVSHRGDAATMITSMVVLEINSWYELWRCKPLVSYFIPNPQLKGEPPNVPADLEPGKRWTGAIRSTNNKARHFRNGRHYVGVYTTTRNRPYLKRIPKTKAAPRHSN